MSTPDELCRLELRAVPSTRDSGVVSVAVRRVCTSPVAPGLLKYWRHVGFDPYQYRVCDDEL